MNHMLPALRRLLIALLTLAALVSWWVFSRLTVDDAFITWRYGKNLLESGVWNYNPSMLDPTQSYTNPIFAILSVVPQLLKIDVVLFFKLCSTVILLAFIHWLSRITQRSWVMILLFFALPATFVHAYAGLETFLYVVLMTALLVALHEKRLRRSLILTILLFLTRPESWLLAGLVPVYFTFADTRPFRGKNESGPSPSRTIDIRRGLISLAVLATALLLYFAFHVLHFDSALPNTFHAKSGAAFNHREFVAILLLAAPLLTTFLFREFLLSSLIFFLCSAVAYSYATSYLAMNYFGRFYFHLFPPIYFFLLYYASAMRIQIANADGTPTSSIRGDVLVKTISFIALILFVYVSRHHSELYSHATYYSRALESHAAIGKTLHRIADQYGIRAYAMGDAGMTAYHSGLNALDTLGLGSAAVAREGITPALIESYGIDLIAFHATPEFIHVDGFNQRPLYDWARANGFIELCGVLWGGDYTFRIWARQPMSEINDLCERSERENAHSHSHFFKEAIAMPPWTLWHE